MCWRSEKVWSSRRSFPSPISWSHAGNWVLSGSWLSMCMFSVRWRTVIFSHRNYFWRHAPRMSSLVPLGTTGRVCWKSPPNAIIILQKGRSGWSRKFLRVLLIASMAKWCCIGASSKMMRLVRSQQVSLLSVLLYVTERGLMDGDGDSQSTVSCLIIYEDDWSYCRGRYTKHNESLPSAGVD